MLPEHLWHRYTIIRNRTDFIGKDNGPHFPTMRPPRLGVFVVFVSPKNAFNVLTAEALFFGGRTQINPMAQGMFFFNLKISDQKSN